MKMPLNALYKANDGYNSHRAEIVFGKVKM